MTNTAFLLTHFETVKPIDFGNRKMVQCPKCGAANEVTDKDSARCHRCGMLFEVEK